MCKLCTVVTTHNTRAPVCPYNGYNTSSVAADGPARPAATQQALPIQGESTDVPFVTT